MVIRKLAGLLKERCPCGHPNQGAPNAWVTCKKCGRVYQLSDGK